MVSGLLLCKSLLPAELVASGQAQADAAYEKLKAGEAAAAGAATMPALSAGERFVPTASSFTIGAIIAEPDLEAIVSIVQDGESGAWLEGELGDRLVFQRGESWVRRQYAPSRYPPMHGPHGWHQDGALGFDFLAYPNGNYPAESLLPMATCWIALNACGMDAPGLEIVMERFTQLVPPTGLAEANIRQQFPAERLWRPVMEPGDALLFSGDILHRTHVSPQMTRDRTSIELRFFRSRDQAATGAQLTASA